MDERLTVFAFLFLSYRTSGKEYRQKEQLAVFASKFPRLSRTEVKELNKAGAKGELEK